jgi:hypothetical protein
LSCSCTSCARSSLLRLRFRKRNLMCAAQPGSYAARYAEERASIHTWERTLAAATLISRGARVRRFARSRSTCMNGKCAHPPIDSQRASCR